MADVKCRGIRRMACPASQPPHLWAILEAYVNHNRFTPTSSRHIQLSVKGKRRRTSIIPTSTALTVPVLCHYSEIRRVHRDSKILSGCGLAVDRHITHVITASAFTIWMHCSSPNNKGMLLCRTRRFVPSNKRICSFYSPNETGRHGRPYGSFCVVRRTWHLVPVARLICGFGLVCLPINSTCSATSPA